MFQVEDHELLKMYDWNERLRLRDFLNEKQFQAGDIGFTYRQIGLLAREPFFEDCDRKKGGWRLFSLRELVGMKLLQFCKDYGYSNAEIDSLGDSIFCEHMDVDATLKGIETLSEDERKNIAMRLLNDGTGGYAIEAAVAGIRMRLLIGGRNERCHAIYCSEGLYDAYFRTFYPHYLSINLNEILDQVMLSLAEKRNDIYFSLAKMWAKNTKVDKNLTDEEKMLIEAVGDPVAFEQITIDDGERVHTFELSAGLDPKACRRYAATIMSLIAQRKCNRTTVSKRRNISTQLNN